MSAHSWRDFWFPLLVLLTSSIAGQADTIGVPVRRATIQAAIDMARDGDEIVVARGTYRECISFRGKAITVRSTDPANAAVVAETVITGDDGGGSIVRFQSGEGQESMLCGFTITNSHTKGNGVLCEGTNPTIRNNVISGCGDNGVLLTLPMVDGGGVFGNTISGNGGWGVNAEPVNNRSVVIEGNSIVGNTLGGIRAANDTTIRGNTITGNRYSGVSCLKGVLLIDNTISGNGPVDSVVESRGAGGGVDCSRSCRLVNNTITNNYAQKCGGGVYTDSTCTIQDNTISDNRAAAGAGIQVTPGMGMMGISTSALSSGRISGNTISNNTAIGRGGGIYGGLCVIENNRISGNIAGSGGGVYTGSSSLVNNTITDNRASQYGGGVCTGGSCTIEANLISGNRAISGGGICLNPEAGIMGMFASGPQDVRISRNTISGNTASDLGGGICSGPCTIVGNQISGNIAARGGGVFGNGSLLNNTITANEATFGGGVGFVGESPLIWSTIVAFNKGGGIAESRSQSQPAWHSPPTTPRLAYSNVFGNDGGNYLYCPDVTGRWGNVSVDPLFADLEESDLHLKSTAGRWSSAAKAWVIDAEDSPCIDAGDPRSAFDQEPAPNGGRVNMGAYGNTEEASKSGAP